jgi:hypothetical protein
MPVSALGVLAVTLLLLAGAAWPSAADAGRAQPVLTISRAISGGFSADGSRLAWLQDARPSGASYECFAVYRHSFVTGATVRLTRRRCPLEGGPPVGGFGGLVLSGPRAFWQELSGGNLSVYWAVYSTARPHGTTRVAEDTVLCSPVAGCTCSADLGRALGPESGSEGTFVYSTVDLSADPSCIPFPGTEGSAIVADSHIHRIVAGPSGLHATVIPNTPGALLESPPDPSSNDYHPDMLAHRAGRVALVPIENGLPPDQPADRVEIRNATSGALVSELSPPGTIGAIGLSRRFAAVLVEASDRHRIIRYAVGTGAQLGSTPVRSNVSSGLDVSDYGIVYNVGSDLVVIPIDTGRARLVHRAVDGGEIEGKRIVWYRTRHGRSQVFQLTLG